METDIKNEESKDERLKNLVVQRTKGTEVINV